MMVSPVFQFTLPRGERLKAQRLALRLQSVSIHAPAWGATGWDVYFTLPGAVSIHAPAWGATTDLFKRHRARRRFNSRSRVGSDTVDGRCAIQWVVSIHAPAWGATLLLCQNRSPATVSIHAPAWGATRVRRAPSVFIAVSIHAPAWGATSAASAYETFFTVSIHAPAWGATGGVAPGARRPVFQFTLPRGERLFYKGDISKIKGFNSRSRVGSDHCRTPPPPPLGVSIHAPAWGATRGAFPTPRRVRVSIHAPAWGATGGRALFP